MKQGEAAAIIVAGGQGRRFGGPVRKQYLKLSSKPLLWWSIRAFEASPGIRTIILVVPEDDQHKVLHLCDEWGFRKVKSVVVGGKERRDSVRAGLEVLSERVRWVAVHDAVRPLVTPDIIEATLAAARKHRAALAASPAKDTVKIADSQGWVRSSPPRETVWLAQTPQTFDRRLLERAHKEGRHWPVTDDAQMIGRLKTKVKVIDTGSENIKVTLPMDLEMAEVILKNRRRGGK